MEREQLRQMYEELVRRIEPLRGYL